MLPQFGGFDYFISKTQAVAFDFALRKEDKTFLKALYLSAPNKQEKRPGSIYPRLR